MRFRSILILVVLIGLPVALHAQANRTWVSGVGDDANPCSRTAPCKTFAGAISKTANGGEIDTIDPGGFGAVTITKSMTIDGNGAMAGVLNSGTNGIVINATATDVVVLRNLNINGAASFGSNNPAGLTGIRILAAGQVIIENCVISMQTNGGISVNTTSGTVKVAINDTQVRRNTGEGIVVNPTGGTVFLTVHNTRVFGNTQSGVNIVGNTKASLDHCVFSNNGSTAGSHAGVLVQNSTASASIMSSDISNNQFGLWASGAGALIRIEDCVISGNVTDGIHVGAGAVNSWGSNYIEGNGGNQIPTGPLTPR